MSIGQHPNDEFASLKELVETLREALQPLNKRQHDLIGVYMLGALNLGKSDVGYLGVIDRYYESQEPKKPKLTLVGGIESI